MQYTLLPTESTRASYMRSINKDSRKTKDDLSQASLVLMANPHWAFSNTNITEDNCASISKQYISMKRHTLYDGLVESSAPKPPCAVACKLLEVDI